MRSRAGYCFIVAVSIACFPVLGSFARADDEAQAGPIAQDATTAPTANIFQERVYHDATGDHKYLVFVPADYSADSGQKWPVILYLHGASARGTDNRVQVIGGFGAQVRARAATFPFVVVFPQCEDTDTRVFSGWEAESADGARALKILDQVERDFAVDRRREILTGWSMGGNGAWNLAASCPERWSAVAVVAGDIILEKAARLKGVRVWSFHGLSDYGVPIERARSMIEVIRQAGGTPYLTELPEVGHNIGHVVYADDALYEWFLHPENAPRHESFVRNATRKPTRAEMGLDFEFPFVPAVEIPDAFYVRMDNTVLETIAEAVPDMIPAEALSGAQPNQYQSNRTGMLRFDIVLSGLSYRGTLEQMKITPHNDGWATMQLGLRNVVVEVAATNVTGRLASASAGPMDIVIGHREPVWIMARVRPSIDAETHRLHLELGDSRLDIPDDNWYVTTPYVEGSGLPIVRRQVADSVAQKMVSDAYGKKHEIEAQITASLPALLAKLEGKLDAYFKTPRVVGSKLPGPTYLPRCVLWPDKIKVDETGLALTLGLSLSRPGLNPPNRPVHRLEGPALSFDQFPKVPGLQIAVAGTVCEGMTEVCTGAVMSSADVRELGVRRFFELSDRRTMTEIIPDLARYGDNLQIRTKFELAAPVSFRGAPTGTVVPKVGLSKNRPSNKPVPPDKLMQLTMSNLRAVLQIKTAADQASWTRCAEFDIHMDYLVGMSVDKVDDMRRMIVTDMVSDPNVTVLARFAPGYEPQDRTLRGDQLAAIFAGGWRDEGPNEFLHGLFRQSQGKDLELGSARVRLSDVSWLDPYVFIRYERPRTRIVNQSEQALTYAVRGPHTAWSQPIVLAPGKSHDFNVPYPLIVQELVPQNDGGGETASAPAESRPLTLPLGTSFTFAPAIGRHPAADVATRPQADADRN